MTTPTGRLVAPLPMALALVVALVLVLAAPTRREPPAPWGAKGHEIATRRALAGLPQEMPAFFRDRGEQLVYLGPEPDRWRARDLEEMYRAFTYDHYIDIERVPTVALDAEDRWEFYRVLYDSGLEHPESDVGFLPFHIVELYQRLLVEWRMWRQAADPERKRFIEDRIVDDAGILGHYVADASQPHHTTIHFNGWAEATPNPQGYNRDRSFHSRFESAFVNSQVSLVDLEAGLASRPLREIGAVRAGIMAHVMESHAQVDSLYLLDRDVGFDPEREDPRTRAFAADRLASGAAMLRDLWWTAWRASAPGEPSRP